MSWDFSGTAWKTESLKKFLKHNLLRLDILKLIVTKTLSMISDNRLMIGDTSLIIGDTSSIVGDTLSMIGDTLSMIGDTPNPF